MKELSLVYKRPDSVLVKEENVGTPSILPFDAPNRQQIAQGHPPDWRPPRPKDGYDLVVLGGGPAGLTAAVTAAKAGPTPGTCSAPGDVGAPCSVDAGITGCADGLDCVSGKCALPPSSGPCVDGECLDGAAFCDSAGQCQPIGANDASCTTSKQCQSGFCNAAGKCAQLAGACHEP